FLSPKLVPLVPPNVLVSLLSFLPYLFSSSSLVCVLLIAVIHIIYITVINYDTQYFTVFQCSCWIFHYKRLSALHFLITFVKLYDLSVMPAQYEKEKVSLSLYKKYLDLVLSHIQE